VTGSSVTVKNALPSGNIKKGTVSKAVVVRTTKEIRRADGSYISFDDNAVVLLNNTGELIGTRIFGPVAVNCVKKQFIENSFIGTRSAITDINHAEEITYPQRRYGNGYYR